MNPGYLTLIVVSVILILLLCGWKDILLKDMNAFVIFSFISGWLVSSAFTFHIYLFNQLAFFNLAFIFLLIYSCIIILTIRQGRSRFQILMAAILLSILDFLLSESLSLRMESIGIIMAVAAVFLQKGLSNQLLSLIIGLLLGNLLSIIAYHRPLVIANQSMQDRCWLTLLITCILAFFVDRFLSIGKQE